MQTPQNQLLFKGESKYQKYSSIFWQVVSIGVAIYCCFHFNENPIVITVIVLFLLFIFLISGYGIVLVYDNSIEFRVQNSLMPFFTKKSRFKLSEIVSIESNLQFGKREQFLADLTNSSIISLSTWNTLKFTFTNGKVKTINSKIYKAEILKAFEVVQQVTQNRVQLT